MDAFGGFAVIPSTRKPNYLIGSVMSFPMKIPNEATITSRLHIPFSKIICKLNVTLLLCTASIYFYSLFFQFLSGILVNLAIFQWWFHQRHARSKEILRQVAASMRNSMLETPHFLGCCRFTRGGWTLKKSGFANLGKGWQRVVLPSDVIVWLWFIYVHHTPQQFKLSTDKSPNFLTS